LEIGEEIVQVILFAGKIIHLDFYRGDGIAFPSNDLERSDSSMDYNTIPE